MREDFGNTTELMDENSDAPPDGIFDAFVIPAFMLRKLMRWLMFL